jgi:hypothetical protein
MRQPRQASAPSLHASGSAAISPMALQGCCTSPRGPRSRPKRLLPMSPVAIVELRRKLFLQVHIASYMGVSKATVSRVLRSGACLELGIAQKFTRAFRPQTNGKAERFIQSALREWAYGRAYRHSEERIAALSRWSHFYNWHRQHSRHRLSAPYVPALQITKQPLDSSHLHHCASRRA